MKTLHLFMGLIFLFAMPFSCETDEIELKKSEIEDVAFEFEFEMNALNGNLFLLEYQKENLEKILKENPENEKVIKELKIVQRKIRSTIERGDKINEILAGYGIGPIPLPGPCFDKPANCPIFLTDIRRIVMIAANKLEVLIQDPKTSEVLFIFEDFKESEFGEGVLEHKFDWDEMGLPELVKIVVNKYDDNEDQSYTTYAARK